MESPRWQRLDALFDAALELPKEEVATFLDRECAGDEELRREAEEMVRAERRAGDFLDSSIAQRAAATAPPVLDEGSEIGPYRILRPLHHGGMGSVYLAERRDDQYRQRVAVKVVRPTLASNGLLERFRTEGLILAGLEHPYIARLYRSGTSAASKDRQGLQGCGKSLDETGFRLRK